MTGTPICAKALTSPGMSCSSCPSRWPLCRKRRAVSWWQGPTVLRAKPGKVANDFNASDPKYSER
jgi:hypothetical protein